MRVLITGGAGFLGSHLSDRFLAEGHTVIAMDNLLTGSLKNIEHLQDNPNFTFVQHNVSLHIDLVSLGIDGPIDALLHFASPASPIDYLMYPIQTLKVGAMGTHNTLGLAWKKQSRYLLASTSEVYGDPKVHPQDESYWGNVDPIGPRGVYDEAKRFAEAITMAYHRTHNVNTHIVRIFNTYGPRMRLDDGRVVPNFIGQALRGEPLTLYGDGMQTRSFCYVSDLVEGLYRLLMSDEHLPVNIGNPHEMTIRQFAEMINDITGNTAGTIVQEQNRIQGDPQTRKPDISKAQRVLNNWEPKIDIREGLERTIEYFRTRIEVAK